MLMKKILLPLLLSLAVVAANAQQNPEKASFDGKAKVEKANMMKQASISNSVKDLKKVARRSKANGVYYTKPDCAMWAGENIEGNHYYASMLILPPYSDLTFVNKSTNPANTTWTWREEAYEAEANGDFYFGSSGCYQTNGYNSYGDAPILSDGTNSFSLKEFNDNWIASNERYIQLAQENPQYFGCSMLRDSLTDMTFYDAAHSPTSYAWGSVHPDEKTSYLYGNGKLVSNGTEYTLFGLSQIYPRPYNMYLTSVHSIVYTMKQPLTGDAKLTMTFYNVEKDEEGEEIIGDKVLGRFYATANDQKKIDGPYTTSYTSEGVVYLYSLQFKNEYQDDFGSWVEQPVTLNEKFAVVITGFDQSGVDVNFSGSVPQEGEDFDYQTSLFVYNTADPEQTGSFGYPNTVIDLTFHALFDYTEVLTTAYNENDEEIKNLNVLKVSADGKTVTNMYEGLQDKVRIYTAYPWLDDQGIGNYFYELPDWISTLDFVDAEPRVSNDVEFRQGYGFATVACDPLPSGVTGRSCAIYIEGRGMRSETPIVVLQGDAKLEDVVYDGIDEVSRDKSNTTSGYYNLNGQKLNGKALKGLIIKDGKKFIVK